MVADPDPDERDLGSADHTHVTGRGFALLGRGIREQRFLFSLSVIGSILYGAMTVADAWVLGWATDHVIRPSFERGEMAFGMGNEVGCMRLGVVLELARVEHVLEEAPGDCLVLGLDVFGHAGSEPGERHDEQ